MINVGSGFNKEPFSPEFDFHGYLNSGLSSFAECGSIFKPKYFQFMGQRFAMLRPESKKILKDMVTLGFVEKKKRHIVLKRPVA